MMSIQCQRYTCKFLSFLPELIDCVYWHSFRKHTLHSTGQLILLHIARYFFKNKGFPKASRNVLNTIQVDISSLRSLQPFLLSISSSTPPYSLTDSVSPSQTHYHHRVLNALGIHQIYLWTSFKSTNVKLRILLIFDPNLTVTWTSPDPCLTFPWTWRSPDVYRMFI